MTLDQAIDIFDNTPSDKSCGYLLQQAMRYYNSGSLDKAELNLIIDRVSEWLIDGKAMP